MKILLKGTFLLRFSGVVIALFFCCTSATFAGSDAVAELKSQLDKVDHFEAQFVQTIVDANSDRLEKVAGHLKIKRPKQFYWETEDPYPQQIISDGQTIWLYDVDLEQVTVKRLNEELERTPAVLLSGNLAGIEANFEVDQKNLDDGAVEFTLKAKQYETNFRQFQFVFQNGEISAMRLYDQLENLTEVRFSDVKKNTALTDDHFTFLPPKGIDVIDQM